MLPSPSLRLPLAAKDDPKMLVLSDHEFRLWIGLLSLAGQADPVGTIPAFPLRGQAAALHTTPDDLTAALTTLTQLGMVTQLPGGAIEISEFAAQYDMAAVVVPPAPSSKARQPRPRRSAVLTLRQAQAFETLWTNHPRRRGSRGEKRAAEIEFAEIPESEWPALALAQRNYILVCSGPNGRYPKDACRWLRDDYWRDYIEIAPLTVLQGGRANEADRITNRVGAIAARVAAGRMAQSL